VAAYARRSSTVLAEDADRYTAGELAAGLRVSPAGISGAVRCLVHPGGRRMRESQHFFAFLDRELEGLLERWREHRTRLDPNPPDDEADAEQAREARKEHHR
jgi:hypothetical protein